MRNVAMTGEALGEGTPNSKAGSVISNSGSVEESGAERGDGHHTRHILGATSLAVEELLSIVTRLLNAHLTAMLPVVVSSNMVGGTAVVRVRAPALTGSEVRHRTHPAASRCVLG